MRIVGTDLPGTSFHDAGFTESIWSHVHVGIQRNRDAIELVPADAEEAVFDFEVELRPGRDGEPDWFGPYVHGRPGKRFLYLSWGDVPPGGEFEMFRRAKLWLAHIPRELAERADRDGRVLEGRLALTDGRGGPLCGGLHPGVVRWRTVGSRRRQSDAARASTSSRRA